jgi:hypothetical protein
MNRFARLSLLGGVLGLFVFGSSRVEARLCQSDNDHQCWSTLSGPNYCQVAVGASPNGVGIACAVTLSQPDSWARMRGVEGEVWVIAGFQHLEFWAP